MVMLPASCREVETESYPMNGKAGGWTNVARTKMPRMVHYSTLAAIATGSSLLHHKEVSVAKSERFMFTSSIPIHTSDVHIQAC